MLAKRNLRVVKVGFFLLVSLSFGIGSHARTLGAQASLSGGDGPFDWLRWLVEKTVALVLPPENIDHEGGYIDPNGRG